MVSFTLQLFLVGLLQLKSASSKTCCIVSICEVRGSVRGNAMRDAQCTTISNCYSYSAFLSGCVNLSSQLIHAFITSRIDYCNSVLYGMPDTTLSDLQRIQTQLHGF